MRSIAVCNLKGGVGKTTTAVNLGACLARNGNRVLLIDCDPQGSLTHWLRAKPDYGGPTLYDVLRGQSTVGGAARPTRWANLSVVPSSPRLQEIDRGALAGERVLWARLSPNYDFVLLDCPTARGVVLFNAMAAANEVIAPVQAKGMALGGLARLTDLIEEVRGRSGAELQLTGVIVCLFDSRTRIARLVLGQLRAKYADLVFDTVVHDNVRLSEAADRKQPITHYDPVSRGAAEYSALAFELLTRQRRAAANVPSPAHTRPMAPRPAASGASPAPASAHHQAPRPGSVAGG